MKVLTQLTRCVRSITTADGANWSPDIQAHRFRHHQLSGFRNPVKRGWVIATAFMRGRYTNFFGSSVCCSCHALHTRRCRPI